MLTYFRVLKRRPPPPALFPAVMEGLAKFVHLVNLDTVQDLLDLLKDLLTEVSARPYVKEHELSLSVAAFLQFILPFRYNCSVVTPLRALFPLGIGIFNLPR